jgi:hypothetical protein
MDEGQKPSNPNLSKYKFIFNQKQVIIQGEKVQTKIKIHNKHIVLTIVRVNLICVGTQKSQACLTNIYKPFQV